MTHTLRDLRADDLFAAASTVWKTVLNRTLSDDGQIPTDSEGSTFYTAWVAMSDVQHYAIYAVCGRQLAREAAAIMFAKEDERIDDADMRDALGEIVNQIAGALIQQNRLPSETGLPHIRPQGDTLPFCQQLVCATQAWCGPYHVYFAVCRYNGEWIVPVVDA